MYTKGSQTPNSKRIMPQPATIFFTKIDSPCFRPRLIEAKGYLEAAEVETAEFEFTVNTVDGE